MADQPKLTTSCSLEVKVNLGNYESGSIFLSISGVSADTTEEEIEEALNAGKMSYDLMKPRLKERVQALVREWHE